VVGWDGASLDVFALEVKPQYVFQCRRNHPENKVLLQYVGPFHMQQFRSNK